MTTPLTLTEAAIYLADRGFLIASRRIGGRRAPSVMALRRWCQTGHLAAEKRGGVWFVTTEALDALIARKDEVKPKRVIWRAVKLRKSH